MSGRLAALVRVLVLCLLALCTTAARADTPIALFQAFRGQVNFVGTEETLRMKDNKQPCKLVNTGKGISANLQGIPSGAKVLSAQLYWAASGATPDYTVTFDGVVVSAPSNRRYTSNTTGNKYFSGAADVTSQVAAKGNGYYTFSGLTVDNGNPWCAVQGVVGGFSLLVVYSHPSEAYRLLNLYEGFQYFQNNGFTLTLNNFAIPDPLPSTVTGRIGHITWEGDATLSGGGEDLLFNGYQMTDAINPPGNQFNSASNVTGDTASYGIDFDAYTVKSPVIQPGQTTATTTYRSGQDMVLLSAEVAALPYIPVADLSLAMTRSGTLQVGTPVTYTLTVTNGGADTEIGPVTLVDTLPAGMTLVSSSGSGWLCSSAAGSGGTTIVTCTQNGPVLSKAVMTPVLLTATPTVSGSLTNSATVSGVTNDLNKANNTASDTGSSAGLSSVSFLFTTRACNAGDTIVANQATTVSTECPQFFGPVTAAASSTVIYITAVGTDASGAFKATPMNANADSHVTVQLALSCAPNSGVTASYAGAFLACDGTTQTVKLLFQANKPSALLDNGSATPPAVAKFLYRDVGQLTLSLVYNNGTPVKAPFVSRPMGVMFSHVVRDADGYPDQNPATDYGFAKAGEPFQLCLAALMADYSYAPSFGKEATPPAVHLDLVSPAGYQDRLVLMQNFDTAGKDGTVSVLVGKARWNEADMLTVSPWLDNYLGSGPVNPQSTTQRTIGRFYPDHFTVEVNPNFDCLAAMNCPAAPSDPSVQANAVDGATWSGEPFVTTVNAWGIPQSSSDAPLTRYQNWSDPAHAVVLSAVSAPNAATAPANGSLTLVSALGVSTDNSKLHGSVSWQLAVPFDPTKPRAGNWSAPLPVYVRASAPETRGVLDATGKATGQAVTISSGTASPTQWEGGVMVVAGRVFVANVFGSELSRVPLTLTAQYWTGSAWQTNTRDNDSVVATSIKLANCTRSFAGCPGGLLPVVGVSTAPANGGAGLRLSAGSGRLTLQAPARGQNGSIDISVLNDPSVTPAAAAWLPSTTGRATFGLFRSPLIYLREVY